MTDAPPALATPMKVLAVIPLSLAGLVVVIFLVFHFFVFPVAWPRSFDAAVWKSMAGKMDVDNPRWAMRDDVLARLRKGMTLAEVVALLGPPDDVPSTKVFERLWNLGMGDGFRMDYYCLHVEFDASDRLVAANVFQH
jgi:hypothetical protein